MKLAEHTVLLKGRLDVAWNKLVDWKTMPEWDALMESVHFDEPLKAGSVGQLTIKGGRKFTLRVTSFEPEKQYTDQFSILGSRFIFLHELEPQSTGEIKMRFEIDGDGLLAFLLQGPLAKDFSSKLPAVMNAFKAQFEGGI